MNSCTPIYYGVWLEYLFFLIYFYVFFYVAICWALVLAAAVAAYHVLCYGGKLPKPAVQELLDVIDWDPVIGAVLLYPLAYVTREGLSDESSYPFVGSRQQFDPRKKVKLIFKFLIFFFQ